MKLLALDTSTEQLSIAVQSGDRVWCHRGAGGAQASSTLIPSVLAILTQANLTLSDLDAVVVGRGPGSFTGLRTACAVAQGLAYGSQRPVLGLETLLSIAPQVLAHDPEASRVLVVLDARMQQVYAAAYERQGDRWLTVTPPGLYDPIDLRLPNHWADDPSVWIAGNACSLLDDAPGVLQGPDGTARRTWHGLPDAQALLQLAPAALARGEAVAAADLMPLYLRDKVALTTAEREALKAQASGSPLTAVLAAPEVTS
jgi:tRNA threonylcarbamoyladenosine biosynthesis protein TsaB